jgi:transcriptional regulator
MQTTRRLFQAAFDHKEALAMLARGEPQKVIAHRFDVTKQAISQLARKHGQRRYQPRSVAQQ